MKTASTPKVWLLLATAFFFASHARAQQTQWGKTEYKGQPWVENVSQPNEVTHGLANRHLSLWASHGRYFDQQKGRWKWQRPNLFGTTEDLFTPTIVVPYLIPMLENAGANVFTPRERDWQTEEVVVDNDDRAAASYSETQGRYTWVNTGMRGFAMPRGVLTDGQNPFAMGTARMLLTTSKRKHLAMASYQPHIKEKGRYAVYVSYQTVEGSIPDAHYTVYHQGQATHFRVNQQMGSGTWVYLGTFNFDAGFNEQNRVVVSNESRYDGFVTTDAVRFGGGMGNIERGGEVSQLPRTLEGARYYAQWAGAPYSVYSSKQGTDDYKDDINVRSFMTNWLAGGSVFVPTLQGKKVPIELSLAVHSDAGFDRQGRNLVGSLAICTTDFHDGRLNSGASRQMSARFADALLNGVTQDLTATYGKWARRYLWDRNYSETRCPEMPSAILETLSHQNFPDMMLAQDPNFRFTLARSVYKTMLRFVASAHGTKAVVQPLAPVQLRVELNAKGKAKLTWRGTADALEPSASPTAYIVYVARANGDFDNGTLVSKNQFSLKLEKGVPYHFRVAAVNNGGRSFPSETVSAVFQNRHAPTVVVVNGFQRLSAPAVRNTPLEQGFDFDQDPGVSYGLTAGWAGRQTCFDTSKMGVEGEGGLGFGGNELAGQFVMGNNFDNIQAHADAIASAGKYNVVSCSKDVVEKGRINLADYHCVDLILGLEKFDIHHLRPYKTFSPAMQQQLRAYAAGGGSLLVSGSYIGSDMVQPSEQKFLGSVLKVRFGGSERLLPAETVSGMGMQCAIWRTLNQHHYACTAPEVLQPVSSAFCAMQYADAQSAAVAYNGADYKAFTMGFPLECIKNSSQRNAIMRGALAFLLAKQNDK